MRAERGSPRDWDPGDLNLEQAARRVEYEPDRTAHHRPLREMPAALMRWPTPEDCAVELLATFGLIWSRLVAEAITDQLAEQDRGRD